ncbi:MAG: site-specific integrase [Candidatus Nitrosopolaris sp.]
MAKLSQENAFVIANYILSVKSETNMSDHYRMMLIKILSKLSVFTGNKPFSSMTRGTDVLSFLDSIRKPEGVDPMHKWIGTYNLYNTILTRFFKWLYSPDIPPAARPKPPVVENIGRLKRREISIYKPTDLWSEEDDKLFLKYCPSKRIKCYHVVSRDTSCRPHEILKLKVKDIVFKTSGNYQYAEVLVNGKTGTRNIPLINSIPYVKDYLDHEHPQPGNPNAPFICGIGKSLGRHVGVRALYTIYRNYKKEYFLKLLDYPNITSEDKEKIRELLKKPWNPYIRRHTGLTEKSLKIPGLINQYAGWSQSSTMPQKYLHYFGNESSKGLLEAYGIIPKDKQLSDVLKPKQCPNCNEPNKPDSKFCAKCRMVLTYDAYNETLEKQQDRESEIKTLVKM